MTDNKQKRGLIQFKDGQWGVDNIHFEGCGLLIKAGKLVAIVGYPVDDKTGAAITVEFVEHTQPMESINHE